MLQNFRGMDVKSIIFQILGFWQLRKESKDYTREK
jgi:cytochrome oxidase assembly protein ShyY1